MRIIVAVIIYDRLKNLQEWIRCWKMCDTQDAELIIIHNYKSNTDRSTYNNICTAGGVKYVPRRNVGMDIGAFQDICRGRLIDFPNQWDYLLWSADDTLPMDRKFVQHYLEGMKKPNIGVCCLELSYEAKLHIRTTGFMLDQVTASKVIFPADKIVSKDQCYDFEHRGKNAFYEQVKKMNKEVVQVHSVLQSSYMWDTHQRSKFDRWQEFYKEFPK